MIQQLLFPGRLYLQPSISFSPPLSLEELRSGSQFDRLLPAVVARGKALLRDHLAWAEAEVQTGMPESYAQ